MVASGWSVVLRGGVWQVWSNMARGVSLVMLLLLVLLLLAERGVRSRVNVESTTDDLTALLFNEEKDISGDGSVCSISLNRDLTNNQPLLLEPDSDRFVWPQVNSTVIELDYDQSVELFCSHGFHKGSPGGQSQSATITCKGDAGLGYGSKRYSIADFTCQRAVFHSAERTGGFCYDNGTMLRIGFDLGTGRFAQLYEVCFDEVRLRTHYVKHQLTPHNDHHQRAVKRPPFLQGSYYGALKMGGLYSYAKQHATLERILGSRARADALLDNKKGMFFARGHLAAKSDFVYGSHQRASFWLLNVAPQWQRFNGFNWQRIETGVKAYVAANGLRLTVYTGTYGVLELPDGNGDPQPIFLDFDADRDPAGRVPAPALFYKVLLDADNDAGLALIGVNNPHATPEEIAERYVVCRDVSSEVRWLQWKRESIADGYSYACDVNEFNRVTGHLVLEEPVGNLLL
uniref:DNA/RNA non-specific endonuclease/pyrophosphatase/phosphodiesterase domain-containing protein n=1 Tax=Anopheles farauti TaxID=69004 RepID=A0A182QHN1_9DIPT